ncbi:MAG: phenylalanine--tRNA ligase subunit alpha [Dehalococcoidales bacterium]|nr:MAG: phenylalanine--tRNA ligase subunit alpha [Dehalococcoidales bacterium]
MREQLEELLIKARGELSDINEAKDLESWRVRYLGRKSELTNILRGLAALSLDERRAVGARANEVKSLLAEGLNQKTEELKKESAQKSLRVDDALLARGDITLPGRPYPVGRLHPVTQTLNEMSEIFASMGFQVFDGPEVEWDYYNFEALNIPEEHPTRDDQSTFWVDHLTSHKGWKGLLRTQTTSVSARAVETMEPPIRVIEFGKCYRYEATDATHGIMFYHIDGLAVDKGITMADLKGTLYEFARRYFGEDRKVRFRCDFFPFVEPGVEMAIECALCHGEGCSLCDEGWLEILGAGMTHPEVLRRGGIDPDVYTSFAFGIGVERLPMLRYGVDDMRLFYGHDLRFLRQF